MHGVHLRAALVVFSHPNLQKKQSSSFSFFDLGDCTGHTVAE